MNIGVGIGLTFGKGMRKIVARDSFTRADSATVLGNADTGQTWEILGGTWGITGNKAYESTVTAADRYAVIPSVSNGSVAADVVWKTGGKIGLVCRAANNTNFIFGYINGGAQVSLSKVVTSTFTGLGNAAFTPVDGTTYKMEMRYEGTAISLYVNGVKMIGPVTVPELTANTKSGIFKNAAVNTQTFDNFVVTAI